MKDQKYLVKARGWTEVKTKVDEQDVSIEVLAVDFDRAEISGQKLIHQKNNFTHVEVISITKLKE